MHVGFVAARAGQPVGVVPPPRGVRPDFVHPHSRQPQLVQACVAGLVFVLVFFFMRIWTRIVATRQLGWDDCGFQSSRARRPWLTAYTLQMCACWHWYRLF